MHVDHLLRMDRLDLSLVWGDETLLGQEIAGVTATDLEDPARFLQPGEVVLSGLVWWSPDGGPGRTHRFVSALREAGAVALLAGEETHGEVPRELVDACRKFRVALIAVPPQTSFRAVTEAVYLRQWGDLNGRPGTHHALPENVRRDLDRALEGGAAAAELLDRAFAHLGAPVCHLLTGSGRTVARTGGAPRLPAPRAAGAVRGGRGTTVRVESESTAFDTWYLHLPEDDQVPPRVLEEISGLLGRFRRRRDQHRAARDTAAARLVAAVGALRPDPDGLRGALEACDLACRSAYTVVTAVLEHGDDGTAALGEALAHLPGAAFAVARGAGDEATAVVAHTGGGTAGIGERLREIGPLIQDCRPQSAWRAGVSEPVPTAAGLHTALTQARYALAAARSPVPGDRPVVVQGELGGLALLLAGIPSDVRKVYRETVLGPLLAAGPKSGPMLLDTLEAFLAHDCSWARTAEVLHIHVNTVHYRVRRIELLTGRDLSRLDSRLDLRTALLC